MKTDITNSLSPEVRTQLEELSKLLGAPSFFIQDTETTGKDELDQIYDFGGMYYEKGRVYKIQYYVTQPDDIDENGAIHTHFNQIRELNKGVAAFEHMIKDEDYEKLRLEMKNKHTWRETDKMITREALADLLRTKYGKIPNFTYNAVFDIKMEKKLESSIPGKKIHFKEVYDVMTIAADMFPEIMRAKMRKELGVFRLEKIYEYLDRHYNKEFTPFKTKKGDTQTHTAWDDVFTYTVPVLNFLIHVMKLAGLKIVNYKNINNMWKKGGEKSIREILDAGLTPGSYYEDYQYKKLARYSAGRGLTKRDMKIRKRIYEAQSKDPSKQYLANIKRTEFKFLKPEDYIKNADLFKDMTIIPLKTTLNDSLYIIDTPGGSRLLRMHGQEIKNLPLQQQVALKLHQSGAKAKIYSVSDFASVISGWFGKNSPKSSKATEFGTAHHKIIEMLFKDNAIPLDSNGRIKELTREQLKKYLDKCYHNYKKIEDKHDVLIAYDSQGRLKEGKGSVFETLLKTCNETLKQGYEWGIFKPGQKGWAEHTRGMAINIGGEIIMISGTIDQIYLAARGLVIGDLKTSKTVTPQYVIQLSLYRALVRATGHSVDSKLKILLSPANLEKFGGVVNIESLTDQELADFIKDAFDCLNTQSKSLQQKKSEKVYKKWVDILDSHIDKKVTTHEVVKDDYSQVQTFINGQSLSNVQSSLFERLRKKDRSLTVKEQNLWNNYCRWQNKHKKSSLTYDMWIKSTQKQSVIEGHKKFTEFAYLEVRRYLNSISNPHDRQLIENRLLRRDINASYLYKGLVFNAYREEVTPNVFEYFAKQNKNYIDYSNINLDKISKEKVLFYVDNQNRVTFAGLTPSEWVSLIRSVDPDTYRVKGEHLNSKTKVLIDKCQTQLGGLKFLVHILSDIALNGSQGYEGFLNSGEPSAALSEEYGAARKFASGFQTIVKKNEIELAKVPSNFLETLRLEYLKHKKEKKDNLTLNDYVSRYGTEEQKAHFKAIRDQAAIDIISGSGKYDEGQRYALDKERSSYEDYEKAIKKSFEEFVKNNSSKTQIKTQSLTIADYVKKHGTKEQKKSYKLLCEADTKASKTGLIRADRVSVVRSVKQRYSSYVDKCLKTHKEPLGWDQYIEKYCSKELRNHFLCVYGIIPNNIKENIEKQAQELAKENKALGNAVGQTYQNNLKNRIRFNLELDYLLLNDKPQFIKHNVINQNGMAELLSFIDEVETDHSVDILSASAEMQRTSRIDYSDVLDTSEVEQQKEEEYESTNINQRYRKNYTTATPNNIEEELAKIPHRVARMLWRADTWDKIKTELVKEYKKKYKNNTIINEKTINLIFTPEQRKEYQASVRLNKIFNSYLNSHEKGKLGQFLFDLAQENYLGSDQESKDLLSSLKSIYQLNPDLLLSSDILSSFEIQITSNKAAYLSKFGNNAIDLVKLGLPLTLIGKELTAKEKPYATFNRMYHYNPELKQELDAEVEKRKARIEEIQNDPWYLKIRKLVEEEHVQLLEKDRDKYWDLKAELKELEDGLKGKQKKKESSGPLFSSFKVSNLITRDIAPWWKISLKKGEEKVIQEQRVENITFLENMASFWGGYMGHRIGDIVPTIKILDKVNNTHNADWTLKELIQEFLSVYKIYQEAVTDYYQTRDSQEQEIAKKDVIKAEEFLNKYGKMLNQFIPVIEFLKDNWNGGEQGRESVIQKINEITLKALQADSKDIHEELYKEEGGDLMAGKNNKDDISELITQLREISQTMQNFVNIASRGENSTGMRTPTDAEVKSFGRKDEDYSTDYSDEAVQRMYTAEKAKRSKYLEATRRYKGDPSFKNKFEMEDRERSYNELVKEHDAAWKRDHYSGEKNPLKRMRKRMIEELDQENKALEAEQAYTEAAEKLNDLLLERVKIERELKSLRPEETVRTKELKKQKSLLQDNIRNESKIIDTAIADVGADAPSDWQTSKEIKRAFGKEQRGIEAADKQNRAIEEYNTNLNETARLDKEILTLEKRINAERKNKNEEVVKILEGRKKRAEEKFSTQRGKTEKIYNELLKSDVPPEAIKTIDETLQPFGDEETLYALKEYRALKNKQTSILDSLNRNNLKYRLTANVKERGALDVQGSLLGMDLEEVNQELSNFESKYSHLKEFVAGKERLDEQFKDIQAKNIVNANVAFKGENTLFGKLATSFKGMLYQFTQFGAAYKILGYIKGGISKIIKDATNLDKAMTDLRIVTGGTKDETRSLMVSYSQLGKQLSATTSEVAKAANDWLRQGYAVNEVNHLITASLYLSKLGMIDSATATQRLTAVIKGFKLEASDAVSVVDKLTKLDMSAAIDAGSIAEGLAQFAATGQIAGLGVDEASALVTAIADVSQKSGSEVGNALRTIISRYGNVKSTKFSSLNIDSESTDAGESLNDVEKVLNKIGVSLRDTSLQFRDFDDVLDDLAEKWKSLDSVSKRAVSTAFAGKQRRMLEHMVTYDYAV